VADAGSLVDRIGPADLARPTPCAGWDLRALLAHLIGQNHGFAEAVDGAAIGVDARPARPSPLGCPTPTGSARTGGPRRTG
jgi:uncharacterized protein (TIGR03083 family)